MRHALGIMGIAAAGVLLVVSAAMNWQFGYGLGKTPIDGQIYGMASAAADGLKALIPFFLFAAVRNRQWSQAIAAVALWGVCLAYSLTSALGFSALNRADTTGDRAMKVAIYKDLRTELDRARERLGWMPQHRPEKTVAEEMAVLKQNRRWRSSAQCTNATAKKSREFCASYHKLAAELATAKQAGSVEAQIAVIKSKLARLPSGAVGGSADPQAEVLARLSGQDQAIVQTGLVILMAILVEFGSSLGFYVVFSQWRIYEKHKPLVVTKAPAKSGANDNESAAPAVSNASSVEAKAVPKLMAPETDVERFYRDRIETAEGSSLTATALYEDYCDWCDENGKEPMALPTFGRQFGEQGVQKAKIAGRIRYIGIRLVSGGEQTASDESDEASVGVVAA